MGRWWFGSVLMSQTTFCFAGRLEDSLSAWLETMRRESKKGAHFSDPRCFLVFEQYNAPAPHLRCTREIKSKRGDIHKVIYSTHASWLLFLLCLFVFCIESMHQSYSWRLFLMYKLVMFTWIHKHHRNPISLSRSIPLVRCGEQGLETENIIFWKVEESVCGLGWCYELFAFYHHGSVWSNL